MGAVTVTVVPRSRRTTPPRSTQIDDAPWFRFGAVAHQLGLSRAGLMATLVLWFVRWPGVKLPTRPTDAEIATAERAFERVEAERKRRPVSPPVEQQERAQ